MITADKSMRHQQAIEDLPLPVLELDTKFNRFPDLEAIAFAFEDALAATATCRFVSIREGGVIERVASA